MRTTRTKLSLAALAMGAIAVLAIALVPADHSVATPSKEGGNCGNCHPYRTASFITVSGRPAGTYTPSMAYTVTISLSDTNGATGDNNFNFIISAGGGTLATSDPNAEINSATEASAKDSVSPMSASSWTLTWTAPSTGSVTINTWAVMSTTAATGVDAPYDLKTVTLSQGAAIPEFPALLVPVIGMAIAIIVVARIKRKP